MRSLVAKLLSPGIPPRTMFLLTVLVVAVLPVGSNRPVLLYLSCAFVWLAFVLQSMLSVESAHDRKGWERAVFGLFALWAVVAVVQQAMPSVITQSLGDYFHDAAGGGGRTADLQIGLDAFFFYASCVAVFWLALRHAESPGFTASLMTALILVCNIESLLGLYEYYSGNELSLSLESQYLFRGMNGTYVNHNHFANLLIMGLPFAIVRLHGLSGGTLVGLFERLSSPRCLYYLLSLLAMLAAILLSASRGALMGLLVGAAVGVITYSRSLSLKGVVRLALVGLVLAVVVVVLFGGGDLAQRLATQGLASPGRVSVWSNSLDIVAASPIIGIGGGMFEYVFPVFKSVEAGSAVYDHMHNSWYELLVEYGLLGGGAYVVATLLPLVMAVVFAVSSRSGAGRMPLGRRVALIAASSAFVAHGMVDFSFQIPANALWFMAIQGVLLARVGRKRHVGVK